MSDLNSLATKLRTQAQKNATVVLDGTVFATNVLSAIRTAFALEAGKNLTITGIRPTDIPDPDPKTGILAISTGTASVLGKDAVSIGLSFTAPGDVLSAVISGTMDPAWKFSDSFKSLTIFPFGDLKTTGARFVYATGEQSAYPWPSDPSTNVPLAAGLNFLSDIALDNFSLIGSLLGKLIGVKSFKLYGPFAPTQGQAWPVGELRAPVSSDGSFGIGVAPNALTLSGPAIAVRIDATNDDNPVQNIDLVVEADFNNTLRVAVGIPTSGGTLAISTTPLPNHNDIETLIESLPGGKSFADFIPGELKKIFANVGLDNFSMVVDPTPKVTFIGLSISTLNPWNVIPDDVLTLETLNLRIETIDPAGESWTRVFIEATAEFLPKIFKDGDKPGVFDFTVDLEKQGSWEVSTVSGAYHGGVNLGDVVGGLLDHQGSVPGALRDIEFSNFGVSATRSDPTSPFTYSFYGNVDTAFPLLDQELSAHLGVAVTKTSTGHTILLNGAVVIGEEAFTIALDLGTSDSSLTATWKSMRGPFGFNDIARAIGWHDMPTLPDSLDLALNDAQFTYDFTSKSLTLSATSKNGKIVFLTEMLSGKRVYLFGLNIAVTGSLSEIPLVGDKLPASANVEFSGLQILIASQALTSDQLGKYKTLFATLSPDLPDAFGKQGLKAGPSLMVNLSAGGEPHHLLLGMPASDKKADSAAPSTPAKGKAVAAAPPPGTGGASPSTPGLWLNLQKSIGPFFFKRIGVNYSAGNVDFMLDASMKISALTLSLTGAGVDSPITRFSPTFRIDGIAIDYESGPVILSGGLLALRGSDGTVTEYDGQVTLAAEEFELAAIAGYSTRGEKSMFAFAILEAPIGGPPFLFVTGVAAGFGYNRDLIIPDAAGLTQFPLVQVVMGQSPFGGKTDLGTAISKLGQFIPERSGENWVALGIRFTTFELLKSFALVTAKFGGEIEFDLIGMSALSIPSEVPSPIAYAELALVGSFKVEEGALAISAQLTSASFVLDRNCHLTGGFAFYFWGKDSASGAKAGDFVVTLGGYHPAFKRPTWYPVEPLLGANWQVSSNLTVKGGYYFALTPSTVMAGGELEAVWESGDLKAWFTAHADFLLCWKPFHYEAAIGISLGASYRVDLLFTSFTVTVHVGVEVDFWGPSFAGRATVDLYVCTLTVTFGDGNPTLDPISWTDFKSSFLPPPPPKSVTPPPPQARRVKAFAARPTALAAAAPVIVAYADDPYCTARAAAGMLQDLTHGKRNNTSDIDWVVNAELVEIITLCVIPSTAASLPDGFTQIGGSSWSGSFGVGPVGIDNGELISTHVISLVGIDKAEKKYLFDATPVLKSVPSATWSKDVALKPGIETANAQPSTIGGVLTGFSLRPTVQSPDQLSPIDLGPLQSTQDKTIPEFTWAQPDPPPSDRYDQTGAMKQFTDGLIEAGDARDALIRALVAQSVGDLEKASVDVSAMAKSATDVLLSAPVLSYLGDQRKAA